MIERTIQWFLKNELEEPIYLEKPEPVPETYVLFEKTGSRRTNRLMASTFAFQSYATSLLGAVELNERVKAAVDKLIESDEIASVRLDSDYNWTDTTTKRYRYQAVFDISHY